MKGLVRAAPTVERVKVDSRSARKHYGFELYQKYDASKGHLASKRYAYMLIGSVALMVRNRDWDPYSGENMSYVMDWYIEKVRIGVCGKSSFTKMRKGEPVKEDVPVQFPLYETRLVSQGPPTELVVEILACEDKKNKGAPVYRDKSTQSQYPYLAEGLLTSCRGKKACGA